MTAFTVATKDQAYAFYLLTPLLIVWQHDRVCQQQQPNGQLKMLRNSLTHLRLAMVWQFYAI